MKYCLAILFLCSLPGKIIAQARLFNDVQVEGHHYNLDSNDTLYGKVKSVFISDSFKQRIAYCYYNQPRTDSEKIRRRNRDRNMPWRYTERIRRFDSSRDHVNSKTVDKTDVSENTKTQEHEGRSRVVRRKLGYGYEVITYDEKNKPIEETTYFDDSVIVSRRQYKYDDSGNLVEELSPALKSEGRQIGVPGILVVYSYNRHNNVAEKRYRYYHQDSVTDYARETYEYDMGDRLIKKTLERRDDWNNIDTSTEVWEYNNVGNITKKISVLLRDRWYGKVTVTTIYKCDSAGNLVSEFTISKGHGDNTETEFTWGYDKMNNWIKQIKYIDHELSGILTRKIEYYR